MTISFKDHFFALAFFVLTVFVIWISKTLLVPLAFGFLFALVLYPLVRLLISKGFHIIWAIITSMLGIMIGGGGIIFFFSAKLVSVIEEFKNFQTKLVDLINKTITFINDDVPFINDLSSDMLLQNMKEFFSDSGLFIVSDTISKTGSFLSFFLLIFLYAFLILLYYQNLTNAFTHFVTEENRSSFKEMLRGVQRVGQKYLTGMFLLIVVLGVLNSIGLLIIGLDYAFFFGFFAAILAIIPYIGTALGGLIPTFYALMTYDSPWYAVAVIAVFWFVQTLEGNFLSPYIVGSNLNLNALVAVLSLIAGGLLWGLPGIILALPFAAYAQGDIRTL